MGAWVTETDAGKTPLATDRARGTRITVMLPDSARLAAERTVKWCANLYQGMGDTKRGRERKGKKKREQLIEQEISSTLGADETPPEPEEPVPDVSDPDLENVSVSRAEGTESEAE